MGTLGVACSRESNSSNESNSFTNDAFERQTMDIKASLVIREEEPILVPKSISRVFFSRMNEATVKTFEADPVTALPFCFLDSEQGTFYIMGPRDSVDFISSKSDQGLVTNYYHPSFAKFRSLIISAMKNNSNFNSEASQRLAEEFIEFE
jgi:hypothetical protein